MMPGGNLVNFYVAIAIKLLPQDDSLFACFAGSTMLWIAEVVLKVYKVLLMAVVHSKPYV
jgi:hypothetical protein